MDNDSQNLFNGLVTLEPHELRDTDIEFLKARQSYLSTEQREKFAEVLGLDKPEADKPVKKTKKTDE